MTVTFVRHGESQGNASGNIDTSVPGPGLTELGETQAAGVPDKLTGYGYDIDAYDGLYASDMIRTQQTAAYADLPGGTAEVIGGFREINAGIFEGQSQEEGLGRLGYALAPLAWTLGARFVRIPGSEDGNEFDARVDAALAQVEANGDDNPVVFSHGATMMFWTLMNVDNPDLMLFAQHPLENTDVVVVESNGEGGWTLKRWADTEVGPATFPIKVFVNVRDLVVAPQTAAYDVQQAVKTGDITTIANTVRDSAVDVATAPVKFGLDMAEDIGDEIGGLTQSANTLAAEEKSATTADRQQARITTVNGATKLTDGNKVTPGKASSAVGQRVRAAVQGVKADVDSSMKQVGETVRKLAAGGKSGKTETAKAGDDKPADNDAA
ncbi:histidine phosphatase family protein [Mycolicibacterium sp. XJ870]